MPSEPVASNELTSSIPDSPTSKGSLSPIPTVPTITSAEYISAAVPDDHGSKVMRNVTIVVASILILIVAFFIALTVSISQAYNSKSVEKKSSSNTSQMTQQSNEGTTGSDGSSSASPNPATGSASIGAEGKYCSNPINAALSC